MVIAVTDYIGVSGCKKLAFDYRDDIEGYFSPLLLKSLEMAEDPRVIRELTALCEKQGAKCLPLGERGLYGGLWDFCESEGLGCVLDLVAVPLRQDVIEVCEYMDANPYALDSLGSLLIGTGDYESLLALASQMGISLYQVGVFNNTGSRIVSYDGRQMYLKPDMDKI